MEKQLSFQEEFTQKECKILEIMHQVLDKTKDDCIYSWVEDIESKEVSVILHHLLFSCRDFLGSIFTLFHDHGYLSYYVISAALVEYFIDFYFILQDPKEREARAKEFFDVIGTTRKPFSNNQKFKHIKERAKECKLGSLYRKTYRSLCSFKHPNLKGHLVTRRDRKVQNDRRTIMLQMTNLYLEMWKKLKDYVGEHALDKEINDILGQEFFEIERLIKKELK